MKIICVVKFVPDMDGMNCDAGNTSMTGPTVRMILHPDDVCALAFALQVKVGDPDCVIEVVSMGPLSLRPHMEDLLRLAVDRGTLISDPVFDHSDVFVTSEVLGRYIGPRSFDCLLTGTHAPDGGIDPVTVQLAERLGLNQMVDIIAVDPHRFNRTQAVVDVEEENTVATYEIALPCVLSLTRESGYKLPYPKLTDMRRDVSDELTVITNQSLCFSHTAVGLTGSLTKIVNTYPKTYVERKRQMVGNDEQGISFVFNFLKQKGFF